MSFGSAQAHRAVAREIRAARTRAGITQAELARRLRCSRAEISAIERGRRRVDVDLLVRIARALNVDAVSLLTLMLG
jgi:transcriptional regulator with XRE-family HTH domain